MDYKTLLDTAVLAGQIMLEKGAETYRVEDTMQRLLSLANLQTAEVYVTTTGFVATLDDPAIDSMTVVHRTTSRSIDLYKIHQVNALSRALCSKEISLEEAHAKLLELNQSNEKPNPRLFSTTVICACFTLTFGGTLPEIVIAIFAGFILALFQHMCNHFKVKSFLTTLLSAAVVAIVASIGAQIIPAADVDTIVIGSIMTLVPGVAITNAVLDTLNGDYLSGTARILEAFVIAAAIAIGIGLGLKI